ncbi:hypothetical protein ASPZODRAFT_390186 [Penicilliopsis zonata CBS 506.65]|uniref:FAD dependent oxidoreductase domain-containing protein n=1 Tax=Penicilliopsis zonata CBS 506.65 TaxID=1073090 RepID=A0A1L9SWB1_9EURO|nr:hypothetical protein ASPZODRAFT_390186 [Penicilliopsis zonata CBS 506.65]OJJ51466.1 hypothetical protein ASPZODRAFT_390186 [Penicilliopsis zonata CBS 506.65]
MALPNNILIVGGGVFGLSTAEELSKRHPDSSITLLEAAATIPNPHGSSVDTSRIIRADYAHPAYARLAGAAIDRWRHTAWGQEGRYTQNGLLLVYTTEGAPASEYAKKSYENVKSLGDTVEFLAGKADVGRVVPAYGDDLNIAGGYINWASGWGDAEAGVRYVKRKLDEEGKVVFRTGEVERVLFEQSKNKKHNTGNDAPSRAYGVALTDGSILKADLVILATGAWTPKLVDLRGRAVSTGQALAYLSISDEEQARLAHVPTILNFDTGIFIIPPRGNLLKIARHAYGYLNPRTVAIPGSSPSSSSSSSGQAESMTISLPENGLPIPPEAERAFRSALQTLLPSMTDRPFVKTRVCWYTDTPKGDFLITYHPDHPGLFLATGGSGHAYKFFPVLGEKIVDALEGSLEPELKKLWAWNTPEPRFTGTEDGSRSGAKGMLLKDELAKSKGRL